MAAIKSSAVCGLSSTRRILGVLQSAACRQIIPCMLNYKAMGYNRGCGGKNIMNPIPYAQNKLGGTFAWFPVFTVGFKLRSGVPGHVHDYG